MSEGNAKTGLEQSPVTDSLKACGPHKSTVTTQRKFRLIRSIRGKKNNPQSLWCLEGTTMSNRGQRPRIHDTSPYSAWRAVRRRIVFMRLPHAGQNVFFLVYRLAMDAKTLRGDDGGG